MSRRLKVLLLFNTPYATPRGYAFTEEFADPENMYTENDVYRALNNNGFEVRMLGVFKDVGPLFDELREFAPDVIFNMVELFKEETRFDKNFAALLEMIGIPMTGADCDTLFICNNKALGKKILRFHRLRVARFHTFYRGHRVWRPRILKLPAVVKPLCEEASRGISQASVVDSDQSLIERVRFIHDNMGMDAIAEEYIEGRELYVSMMGRKRLTVFPPRELIFGQMPEDEPRIATYKAKWDDNYRDRWGIKSVYARLTEAQQKEIAEVCKRAYRALNVQSYIRFDIRLTPEGRVYFIEPNANPCLAKIDEFAMSAQKAGLSYDQLIRRIVLMPLRFPMAGAAP